MMQNKLSPNQIERVCERFHDHPLLVACRQTFECYEADMERLLFAPEEIFLEAAIILDRLLTEPDNAKKYIDRIWIEEKRKIRNWIPEAPQGDVNKVSGAILFVVAAVLCQHYHQFFCDYLKDSILDIVRKNMPMNTAEEERIIKELSMRSDGLSEWLVSYVDSDVLLSEEVLYSFQEPKKIVQQKKPKKTRISKDVSLITKTFEYNKEGKDSVKNNYLSVLFSNLKSQKLIAEDSDQKSFLEIFYGEESHNKIGWTGKLNLLHYIFDQWVTRKYVVKPTGVGMWQIVAAHFYIQKIKNGKISSMPLTAEKLKDAGNPKNVSDDIENIIELLNPKSVIKARRNSAF